MIYLNCKYGPEGFGGFTCNGRVFNMDNDPRKSWVMMWCVFIAFAAELGIPSSDLPVHGSSSLDHLVSDYPEFAGYDDPISDDEWTWPSIEAERWLNLNEDFTPWS